MHNDTLLLDPIPTGEILREGFMRPLGLTITRLPTKHLTVHYPLMVT